MTAPEIPSSTSSPNLYSGKPKHHHHHHHHHHTTNSTLVSPDRRGINEVECALIRSLRNENDLLRCQLNDLIAREKLQRIELQRLRQHRESDVNSMVHTATSELKAEVEQLKGMLQSTSGQLLQALSEREQARSQKEKCARLLEETKQVAAKQESHLTKRLESFEDMFKASLSLAVSITQNVDAFQRHVLPTFKPSNLELRSNSASETSTDTYMEGKALLEQLTRLGSSLALLRVIVDAKNDTLILIRGKLKQENEELRAELQVAQEVNSKHGQLQIKPFPTTATDDNNCIEKNNFIRQELQSMQELFNEEVSRLKAKIKMYESEEQHGQGRLVEVQRELDELQNTLSHVEASRASLEVSLKEETSARSQLVSQLFTLRKENEKIKTELETLKLSQKFLVRQPRSGHLPMEKMDLMNTVNQLLNELNKTKGEKVALEEELKTQKISHMRERVKRSVTPRDVEMAAANKVADSELATKLARARLQQLTLQENSSSAITTASRDGSAHSIKQPSPCNSELPLDLVERSIQGSQSLAVPYKDEIMGSPLYGHITRKSCG